MARSPWKERNSKVIFQPGSKIWPLTGKKFLPSYWPRFSYPFHSVCEPKRQNKVLVFIKLWLIVQEVREHTCFKLCESCRRFICWVDCETSVPVCNGLAAPGNDGVRCIQDDIQVSHHQLKNRAHIAFTHEAKHTTAKNPQNTYTELFLFTAAKNHGHKCFITERKQREMGHNIEPPNCQQTTRC